MMRGWKNGKKERCTQCDVLKVLLRKINAAMKVDEQKRKLHQRRRLKSGLMILKIIPMDCIN